MDGLGLRSMVVVGSSCQKGEDVGSPLFSLSSRSRSPLFIPAIDFILQANLSLEERRFAQEGSQPEGVNGDVLLPEKSCSDATRAEEGEESAHLRPCSRSTANFSVTMRFGLGKD